MDLWRISNHRSLNDEGGRLYAARWHTAGAPIIYLASSPAGALLEVLVHLKLKASGLPPTYTRLQIAIPGKLRILTLAISTNSDWRSNLSLTRALGDGWLRSRLPALARLPSAVLPHALTTCSTLSTPTPPASLSPKRKS